MMFSPYGITGKTKRITKADTYKTAELISAVFYKIKGRENRWNYGKDIKIQGR